MDLLNGILECIPCTTADRKPTAKAAMQTSSHNYISIPEKAPPHLQPTPSNPTPTAEEAAASEILTAVLSAPKPGATLSATITSIVHTQRPRTTSWATWRASLAEAVFHHLENLLKEGRTRLGGALADAFRKASDAVDATGEFAREHPLWTAAVVGVVVLGILVLVGPWLVEALGFAELGPVEGSFAAGWQARYLGAVPKGSLFGYLQRLGMVWKKVGVMQVQEG